MHNSEQLCTATNEKYRPNPKNGGERKAKPSKPPATSHQPLPTSHGGRKAAS
jgi:hypothetical protein